MAVNKPVGDNARKGAVKKAQLGKDKVGRRQRLDQAQQTVGKFMAVKKPTARKISAKKFKGVQAEKKAAMR